MGPGCPQSTAAWRSSSCPSRASSASSFRSAAATLTFTFHLIYMFPSWMHFSSANVISMNNGQLWLGQTICHLHCWELAGLWIPLHAFLLLTLLGTVKEGFYEATFANTKSQVTSTAHFLMSPSEITTENKSTCTCTTTKDTSKLIHKCNALFIYSLKLCLDIYRVFFFLWIQSGGCKSAILRSFMLFFVLFA